MRAYCTGMEDTPSPQTALWAEKSDWFIAAIFFVAAGFVAPWVVGAIMLNLYFAGGSEYLSRAGLGGSSIGVILTCVAIYLAVLLVAKIVKKNFVIRSPKRIALIAAGYFVFILVPWYAYESLVGLNDLGLQDGIPMLMTLRLLALATFAYA